MTQATEAGECASQRAALQSMSAAMRPPARAAWAQSSCFLPTGVSVAFYDGVTTKLHPPQGHSRCRAVGRIVPISGMLARAVAR